VRREAVLPLTAAELHVARCAAEGLSNRAIALRRGSSARTVANQMASILRKLAVGSRAALASIPSGPPPYLDVRCISPREARIVALVARGASQKVVAIELRLGLSTVSTALRQVRERFGLHSNAELSRAYLEHAEDVEPVSQRWKVVTMASQGFDVSEGRRQSA
jgi:DNA-binding CsgD family transcriptional regulator